MTRKALLVLSCLAGLTLFILAAKPWEKKDYTQWDAKDVQAVLTNSPWIKVFIYSQAGPIGENVTGTSKGKIGGPPIKESEDTLGDSNFKVLNERETKTIIRVSLYSSRPIRQAFMLARLKGDIKKLNDRMKDFITRDINDEISLSWNVSSVPPGATTAADVERQLRSLSLTELAQNTFLATDEGKKVFIKDFIQPPPDGTGAKFVFPRNLPDGTPLITEKTKSLRFQTKDFKMKDEKVPIDVTFKVSDFQYQGKLDY